MSIITRDLDSAMDSVTAKPISLNPTAIIRDVKSS